MSVVWTEDQRKVINIRNRNLLVSAAAGSGKTAVLVERIVSLITDKEQPVDVETLKAAITETGYTVTGVQTRPYEKKGFFSFLKK